MHTHCELLEVGRSTNDVCVFPGTPALDAWLVCEIAQLGDLTSGFSLRDAVHYALSKITSFTH